MSKSNGLRKNDLPRNESHPISLRSEKKSATGASNGVIIFSAIVIAFALFGLFNVAHLFTPASDLKLESSPNSNFPVSLSSATVERKLGYISVFGSAESESAANLTHVEAVVELLDANRHTLKVESGLVEFDPLPSNQAAPFHVELSDNPNAVSYRVRFRQMAGTKR